MAERDRLRTTSLLVHCRSQEVLPVPDYLRGGPDRVFRFPDVIYVRPKDVIGTSRWILRALLLVRHRPLQLIERPH